MTMSMNVSRFGNAGASRSIRSRSFAFGNCRREFPEPIRVVASRLHRRALELGGKRLEASHFRTARRHVESLCIGRLSSGGHVVQVKCPHPRIVEPASYVVVEAVFV